MKALVTSAFCFVLPVVVQAQCPPSPDHSAAFAELVTQVQQAPNEMAAREVSNKMWELWADAPNEQAQSVLDRGMGKRASYDLYGAIEEFDRLIEYCPDYAEGYNQRAFANFIAQRYDRALPDLYRALELSPDHIAARAGLALTLMQLGQLKAAREELRRALDQNPWLSERHLMSKGGPLAPEGDEI